VEKGSRDWRMRVGGQNGEKPHIEKVVGVHHSAKCLGRGAPFVFFRSRWNIESENS